MKRTVYFHIGWGRCGSSAIQQFGYSNRDELRRRGVFYPTSSEMGLPEFGGANARAMCDLEPWRPAVDAVVEYLARSPDRTFLLSSEYLSSQSPEYFGAVKAAFASRDIDMVCVAYVRDQREWLLSRYAQAVKARRWTIPLSEFLQARANTPTLNYHLRFRIFQKVFGAGKVVPRVFQRDRLAGSDVRVDLFDLMEVDVRDLIDDDSSENASASVLELETMRAVNAMPSEKGFNNRRFLRLSRRYFEAQGWEPVSELHRLVEPSLVQEIGRYFEPSNEAFRRAFFPDVEPPLFRPKIPQEYDVLPPQERINERSIALLLNYFTDLRNQGSLSADRSEAKRSDGDQEKTKKLLRNLFRFRIGFR